MATAYYLKDDMGTWKTSPDGRRWHTFGSTWGQGILERNVRAHARRLWNADVLERRCGWHPWNQAKPVRLDPGDPDMSLDHGCDQCVADYREHVRAEERERERHERADWYGCGDFEPVRSDADW